MITQVRLLGQSRREKLLDAIRWLEAEPSLLEIGAHLMAIARKKIDE